jgi:hypothetical protein
VQTFDEPKYLPGKPSATMPPTLTRAVDVELIRDGGSYAATFCDEEGGRYILFTRIKHIERSEATKERIGYEQPILIDCNPTKRPPNTDTRMYGDLSGSSTAITWAEARAFMALTKGLAKGLDARREKWLDQMNHVVASDGGLPPDVEAIAQVRRPPSISA